jgi:hypothetical protein
MARIHEFYSYMQARERIRLNRKAGLPWPWTDDPILQTYKFTNVKRAHDRTTREFAQFYRLHPHAAPSSQLLNCTIARYFGTYDFLLALGWQTTFNPELLIKFARDRLNRKERVFTGAYLITNNGIKAPKEEVVVNTFIASMWEQRHAVIAAARARHRWEDMVGRMRSVTGFGGSGFMAKEVALDTMLTNFWTSIVDTPIGLPVCSIEPIDKATWSPAGPGARRGLNRLLGRDYKKLIGDAQALDEMRDLYEVRDHYWPADWIALDLHDIQFQLCEWDKYERVRLGQGRPRSKYRPPENA